MSLAYPLPTSWRVVHQWQEDDWTYLRLDDGDEIGLGPEWPPELLANALDSISEGLPVAELLAVSRGEQGGNP